MGEAGRGPGGAVEGSDYGIYLLKLMSGLRPRRGLYLSLSVCEASPEQREGDSPGGTGIGPCLLAQGTKLYCG